jgi:hypothetical protein
LTRIDAGRTSVGVIPGQSQIAVAGFGKPTGAGECVGSGDIEGLGGMALT